MERKALELTAISVCASIKTVLASPEWAGRVRRWLSVQPHQCVHRQTAQARAGGNPGEVCLHVYNGQVPGRRPTRQALGLIAALD